MAETIVLNNGEGERRWFLGGGIHTWKAFAKQTDGALFAFEDELERGKVTPLHAHPDHDEAVFVIEGEILFNADGEEHTVSAGGFTFTPRGCAHAFVVTSERARLLAMQTPGTGDAFYYGASEPLDESETGRVDVERIGQVATETGTTKLLGPPPFEVARA